jgi:lysozyme family protein
MSNFKNAILFVLRNEGGYSDDKADKGGATNLGISTRFLKLTKEDIDGDGHITEKDVLALTKERAVGLYKKYFWSHYKLDNIRDLIVGRKALDLFVNMRGKAAAKIIQQACVDCGSKIKVDGVLGQRSFYAVNRLGDFTNTHGQLIDAIIDNQIKHYNAIVKNDKTQSKFLKGWINRAKRF